MPAKADCRSTVYVKRTLALRKAHTCNERIVAVEIIVAWRTASSPKATLKVRCKSIINFGQPGLLNPIQGEGARLMMSTLWPSRRLCLLLDNLFRCSIVVVCFESNWLASVFILIFKINEDIKHYHCYLLLGLIGTNIDLLFSDFGLWHFSLVGRLARL